MSKPYWNNSPRNGLSLIEVIASTALLATLLVGSLVAHGRHARQIRLSRLRLQATRAADTMLAEWISDPATLPVPSRGDVPEQDDLVWQTRLTGYRDESRLGIGIVRLSVSSKDAAEDKNTRPLVVVDVVVPTPVTADADLLEEAP